MWCRHCLREVSPSQGSSAPVVCPFCGRSVEAVSAQSQAVRQAREILERWQASDLFDRITSSDVIPENKQQARVVPPALPQPEKTRTEPPRRPAPEALPRLPQPAETPSQPGTGMDWRKAAREVQERPQTRTVIQRTTTAEAPEPSVKSVIRELPQLPLELLAPAPVMAAPNSINAANAANAAKADPLQTAAHTSISVDDWEPPPRYPAEISKDSTADVPAPAPAADEKSDSENDSAAAIEAFFEASAADLFPTAETQTPTAITALNDTPPVVALTPSVASFVTPAVKTEIAPVASDPPQKVEQTTTPDEPPAEHADGKPQRSGVPSSGDSKEASTPDAPVILQATSPRPRPALRRPPLNRRISAQQEPVQPISGTIPMNRNTNTEAAKLPPGEPAPVTAPAIAPVIAAAVAPVAAPTVAHSPAPVSAPIAAPIADPVTAPIATALTTPATVSVTASSMAPAVVSVAPAIVSNSPESGIRERRDAAESVQGERPHMTGWVRPPQRYIDEPHQPPVRGPHFELSPPPRSNFTTMIGQGLAYIGVIALLIGTSLVILGHFGGESDYTPTGWLVTTVAQMLLFLGIINLVSGGMEQQNDEVARRIHSLSEHLIRIEQTTAEAVMAARLAGVERTDSAEVVTKTSASERVSSERRTAQHV